MPSQLFVLLLRDTLAMPPPFFGAITVLNSWPVGAVKLAISIPFLGAVSPLNSRTASAVQLAIEPPGLVAVSPIMRWSIGAVAEATSWMVCGG